MRPSNFELSLGIIDHEFVIDHPATDVTEARFHCCNGGVLIRIIVWIECQIDTGIIGITVRRWQVLANDIKKLTSVKGEQHWAETKTIAKLKLNVSTIIL